MKSLLILLALAGTAAAQEARTDPAHEGGQSARGADIPAPTEVTTSVPDNDDGTHIQITARAPAGANRLEIRRGKKRDGDFTAVATVDVPADGGVVTHLDQVPEGDHFYAVVALGADGAASAPVIVGPERAVTSYLNRAEIPLLLTVILMMILLSVYLARARRSGKKMFIRRIAGIDAMEEAIGRATEMGRPVLYVPGIDEIQNIQTVASLLILGHVSEMVARYDAEIRVPCAYPFNMIVAEEIVRQGFYNAGRPDAHRPHNVMFISSEQFAFTAAVSGMILREKPATNIFLGRFFAEALILAESGYVNKSIQIGGTAEITQLPFFIAACDYTIIGEELYAVSAYLSREPRLLSTLKATDAMKFLAIAAIVVLAALTTFGVITVDDAGKFLP